MDEANRSLPGGAENDVPVPIVAELDPATCERILRECTALFVASLRKAARTVSETATDLFDTKEFVDEKEQLDFLVKREQWVERFVEKLSELIELRCSGQRRRGRRPDPDVSLATLRVLNPFDQEKQAAISQAVRHMKRWSRKEQDALDLRVSLLLNEPVVRDLDNPFGPDYVVDGIGASTRAMFPNPRIWRPFMERVLVDVTPSVPKAYITLNRFLADSGVLPEIKAALRARSELRPSDDKELLPLFARLIQESAPDVDVINVEVPPVAGGFASDAPEAQTWKSATAPAAAASQSDAAPAAAATHSGATQPSSAPEAEQSTSAPSAPHDPTDAAFEPLLDLPLPEHGFGARPLVPSPASAETRAAVQATASVWPQTAPPAPRAPKTDENGFPSLDPMLTLGSSSSVFEVLAQWQSFDPQNDATQRALKSRGIDTAALPLNRIPYIRVAMGAEPMSPTDKITMDVISLLFDYIFRDPSIPDTARGIFGRLQVPILKAALLERTFFSDKNHPARRVLDRLAAAAVGSGSEKAYRVAFEGLASRVVDMICREFVLDVEVFERADRDLAAFLDSEHRTVVHEIGEDVETALEDEARETDKAHARALVRDRLAGLRLPLDVRVFAETAWADYLTVLRQQQGDSGAYADALQTMDDLLWSITAKERNAQKARLTKMVPRIIGSLRKGCKTVEVPDDRSKQFFDTLYELHMAAIRPRAPAKPPVQATDTNAPAPGIKMTAQGASTEGPASQSGSTPASGPPTVAPRLPPVSREEEAAVETGGFRGTDNFHDYVSEMPVGTWLAFRSDNDWINARLAWVSPLRTKYIFTSRNRSSAFVYSPEELALELAAGRARVVLEPVPLFDRAVSAALDSIAAKKPVHP